MSELDPISGSLHGGDGVVARWPGVVLVIPAHHHHEQAVAKLLRDLGGEPHRDLVVKLVHDLIVNRKGLVAAALLVETDGGLGTMAYGPTEILINDAPVMNGTGGPNTDLIAIHGLRRLTIRPLANPLSAVGQPPYELRLGIAPGAGITLDFGGVDPQPKAKAKAKAKAHSQPIPKPALPLRQPPDPVDLLISSPSQTPDPAPSPQPPPSDPVHRSTSDHTVGVMVEGVVCPHNHFNGPRSNYCSTCGVSIPPHAPYVHGYRPSLGYLVFDDNTTYALDRSYVLGREPGEVTDPHTDALTLPDDKEIMSRLHAEIRLVDWEVRIVDRSSTNGTYLWNPRDGRWDRLPAEQAVPLNPGSVVMVGPRSFTYEARGAGG